MLNDEEKLIITIMFKVLLVAGFYLVYVYYNTSRITYGILFILLVITLIAARTSKNIINIGYSDFIKRETFAKIDKYRFHLLLQGLANFTNQLPHVFVDKARRENAKNYLDMKSRTIIQKANELFEKHTNYQIKPSKLIRHSLLRSLIRLVSFNIAIALFLLLGEYPNYQSMFDVLGLFLIFMIFFIISEGLLNYFLIVGEIRVRLRAVDIGYWKARKEMDSIKETVEEKNKKIKNIRDEIEQKQEAKQKILDVLIKEAQKNPFLQTKNL